MNEEQQMVQAQITYSAQLNELNGYLINPNLDMNTRATLVAQRDGIQNMLAGVNANLNSLRTRAGGGQFPQKHPFYAQQNQPQTQPQQYVQPQYVQQPQQYVQPQYVQQPQYLQQPQQYVQPQYNNNVYGYQTTVPAIESTLNSNSKYDAPRQSKLPQVESRVYQPQVVVEKPMIPSKPLEGHEFEPLTYLGCTVEKEDTGGNYHKFIIKGRAMDMGNFEILELNADETVVCELIRADVNNTPIYNGLKAMGYSYKAGIIVNDVIEQYEVLVEKEVATEFISKLFTHNTTIGHLVNKLVEIKFDTDNTSNTLTQKVVNTIIGDITKRINDILKHVVGSTLCIDSVMTDFKELMEFVNDLDVVTKNNIMENLTSLVKTELDGYGESKIGSPLGVINNEHVKTLVIAEQSTVIFVNNPLVSSSIIGRVNEAGTVKVSKQDLKELFTVFETVRTGNKYIFAETNHAKILLDTSSAVYELWYNPVREYYTITNKK